ncbi:MAG TPA: Crp/Fnr family transcriptional regulator [Rhizomicrobium sp.]|jgi:CRP-like cAMP-binding protein|nr:Crp/Fnr family transcriptional regulator [Rhizomicrobium sp.]
MSSKVADTLARNGVFSVLSPARRKMLADSGTLVALNKGDSIFKRGDASDAAYAIIIGEVEVTVDGLDGRSVFLARLGAATVLGEMGILDGAPRSADAAATRRTELWRIDRKMVTDALMAEPGAALALLGVLARRLRDTDALVERTSSMDLGKRLARLLLDESAHGRIIYSQSDMAHLISASREAVNRKLSRWRKSKWIELNHTGLHVLDRAALLALCRKKSSL